MMGAQHCNLFAAAVLLAAAACAGLSGVLPSVAGRCFSLPVSVVFHFPLVIMSMLNIEHCSSMLRLPRLALHLGAGAAAAPPTLPPGRKWITLDGASACAS